MDKVEVFVHSVFTNKNNQYKFGSNSTIFKKVMKHRNYKLKNVYNFLVFFSILKKKERLFLSFGPIKYISGTIYNLYSCILEEIGSAVSCANS